MYGYCCGCISDEEEESVMHILCQYPIGTSLLVSLMEISSIDIKDIALLIKISGWFSNVNLSCRAFFVFPCFGQNLVASQRAAMHALVSFVIS